VNWRVEPNQVIPAGTYTVLDSDPATWSQNAESRGQGFSDIRGVPRSIFSGNVSGTNGGEIAFGTLALSFPPGASNGDMQVAIKKQSTLPEIEGDPELIKIYKEMRVVGDIFDIKTGQAAFNKPFYLEFKFDPARIKAGELYVCTVADGKLSVPEIIAGDLEEGYVIIRSKHGSTWFLALSAVALPAVLYVGYKAYTFVSNENNPWNLIEPNHPKISAFIANKSLGLPAIGPATERFKMVNYDRKFKGRDDTYFNRVVNLTGRSGSEVLDQEEVACWDLTTFFGSILYSMKPDISQNIRLVKGTLDGTRHSWIEIVVDGQIFVVNTGRTDAFEFVARDVLYKEQKLKPARMYTKNSGSLTSYDPEWFKPFLYDNSDTKAKIAVLKAEHKKLQGELERLQARGESITIAEEKRMIEIRARQSAIFAEVKELQKKLPK
jgi:hypothetical protein